MPAARRAYCLPPADAVLQPHSTRPSGPPGKVALGVDLRRLNPGVSEDHPGGLDAVLRSDDGGGGVAELKGRPVRQGLLTLFRLHLVGPVNGTDGRHG
jgi:hypothetical protein